MSPNLNESFTSKKYNKKSVFCRDVCGTRHIILRNMSYCVCDNAQRSVRDGFYATSEARARQGFGVEYIITKQCRPGTYSVQDISKGECIATGTSMLIS